MLNDVYICHVIRVEPDGSRKTAFTFISGGDEGRAQYLAGAAADAYTDATGHGVNWFVEPLPYVGSMAEAQLLRMVREVASDETSPAASAEDADIPPDPISELIAAARLAERVCAKPYAYTGDHGERLRAALAQLGYSPLQPGEGGY